MAISDFLEKVGEGVEKGAKVAGTVAGALGKGLAEEEAGYAPEIAKEKRQHAQSVEDAQLASQEKLLESKLSQLQSNAPLFKADGTPMNQQERWAAINEISNQYTQIYSHPRHAPKLMEKLRQIVHPHGAVAGPSQVESTPAKAMTGFTAAAPEGYAEKEKLKNLELEFRQSKEQKQQEMEAAWKFFSKYLPPEELPKIQSEWAMKNLGVASVLKPLAGKSGEPYKGANGEYVRPMMGANGETVTVPMPPDWKPPESKPLYPPKVVPTAHGNVYMGYNNETKKFDIPMADAPPTFAQTGLYEIVPSADPTTGAISSGVYDRRSNKFLTSVSGNGQQPIAPPIMAQISKNLEPALEADTRFRVMADNLKDALDGKQQAMLSLVANHIGMTLGQQKGSRINQAVWNEAIQSAPWLETIYNKWFHTDANGDHIFDGYKSGVNITKGQIQQMVQLAQQRRLRQWQQAQQAGAAYGVTIKVPNDLEKPSTTLKSPTNSPGKLNSLVNQSKTPGTNVRRKYNPATGEFE